MEKRTDPAAVVELSAAASDDWIEENQLPDSEVLIFPAFLTHTHTKIQLTRKERNVDMCVYVYVTEETMDQDRSSAIVGI